MFPWNLFPFNKETQNKLQQMKPEDINQYVQNAMGQMSKMFHPSAQGDMNPQELFKSFQTAENETRSHSSEQKESSIQYSVYETHDFVFVRIVIEQEEWLQQLKLYHTSTPADY